MKVEKTVIIGSGPAAYSAAMFLIKYEPLLFEGEFVGEIGPGGQLTTTTRVDNYPGFPEGTEGPVLMDQMREQAEKMGVRIISKTVVSVKMEDDKFTIEDDENTYYSLSVIVATGASAKRLYVPGTGDDEFWQKGISACAVCDGFFFKNKIVAVIGGGDSAMEETLYLSNIASKVYLIHRRNVFKAREDKLDKVRNSKNIEMIVPAVLESAHGESTLKYLKLKNPETDEVFELQVDGLFFGIGHTPNASFLNGLLELEENGYVKTDSKMRTNIKGIFACGDVQDYHYRQAVTAASSGYVAAQSCIEYLESINK